MALLPADARVGLFGKLPSRGDFLREGLPRDFVDGWDAWWQRGLALTQQRPQEEWRDAWLEAPVWRFALPPGLCGVHGVLGLWMPSVDKAGRYFPLTLAATAAADWAPLVPSLTPFLDEAEEAGRDALELDVAPGDLLDRLQRAFVTAESTATSPLPAEGQATWWTDGGPRVAARLETGSELPGDSRFAALIDDGWSETKPQSAATAQQPAEPS
jgi:type VI secretion system protein ImpM